MVLFNDSDLVEYLPSLQNMHSETCVRAESIANIQYGVSIGHPIVARNGVQDKLHLAPQDKMAALRTAKSVSPLVLFSIWRGPPSYG